MTLNDSSARMRNQRFLKMSVVTLLLSPSLGRGTPEGQGVGRRRKRAKPTSGATRHLLPKEGGRSGMGKELVTQSMGSADSIAESDFTRGVYIASRRDAFASLYYRRRCPKVVFKSPKAPALCFEA